MPSERIFQGWKEPVLPLVCRHLLRGSETGLADLRDHLVVVPTRHAGRRLREHLALMARSQQRGLLAPLVVQPSYLFRPRQPGRPLASDLQILALLSERLRESRVTEMKELLPRMPEDRSALWCHSVASMVLKLRKTLQNHHYTLSEFVAKHETELVEQDRWSLLVELERDLQSRLERVNLLDPVLEGLKTAASPDLPAHIQTIVLAANPDPAEPAVEALKCLEKRYSIEVLIHAPAERAEDFDHWGRPVPDHWKKRTLPLPDVDHVHVSGSAAAQVERVLDTLARLPDNIGPRDISIALPDPRYADRMDIRLKEVDVDAFDPSGEALAHQPLFSLLRAFRSLVGTDRWTAFRSVARHEHILQWLEQETDFCRLTWLKALDDWHEENLPLTFENWLKRIQETETLRPGDHALRSGVTSLGRLKEAVAEQPDIQSAIQHLCQTVYGHREIERNEKKDDAFRQAAERLHHALQEWSEIKADLPLLEAWGLILRALAEEAVYIDRSENSVALEGWLELHWSPAPVLIVTGMHEGHVPDTRMEDMFLPETLREKLGLESDGQRFARDAFLYESALRSRDVNGEVHMVMGRLGPDQKPLKPSRLLLAVHDPEEMLRRCPLFFGEAVHEVDLPDLSRPSLNLNPSMGAVRRDLPGGKKTLSVGGLGRYLQCPFQFYLEQILGMKSVDAVKSELSAADSGSLLHEALDLFQDPAVRAMDDGQALSSILRTELDRLAGERYGSQRPLFLRIQLDAMKQRLHWAAMREVVERQAGWETLHTELDLSVPLDGMVLRGRIDRVDRHADGRCRIVDYKSSAKPVPPQRAHIRRAHEDHADYRACPDGKHTWIQLQLPMYVWMFKESTGCGQPVYPAYFNLPRAVRETGVYSWEAFSGEWMDSAVACARGVIQDIRDWRFWPPAKQNLQYDLGTVFPSSLEHLIDHEAFESFLAMQRGEGGS